MPRRRSWPAVSLLLLLASVSTGSQAPALRVVRADPVGPLDDLADADQVRIVFSEPMVPVGTIPDGSAPPWIRMTPAVPGSFYWSGTRTLVFSPDAHTPLPYATRFTVRVDPSATSVSGLQLGAPYELTFTTPPIRLLESHSYRKNRRFDDPLVIVLRFNQPVRPEDVVAHARAAMTPHEWETPRLTDRERQVWLEADPEGLQQFDAKVAAVDRVAASTDPVALRVSDSQEQRWFFPGPEVVVVETTTAPPPDAWLTITVDEAMPSLGGAEPHPEQSTVVRLEPTFFVLRTLGFSRDVSAGAVADALTFEDVTDPADVRAVAGRGWSGLSTQPPMTRWRGRLGAQLRADDGQTLGYRWVGVFEKGHLDTAVIIPGHVFEAGRELSLPLLSRNFTALTEWLVPVLPSSLLPALRNINESARAYVLPSRAIVRQYPAGPGELRSFTVVPDRLEIRSFDVRPFLPRGTGLLWATYRGAGTAPDVPTNFFIPFSEADSALLQVTNLGLTVKHGPQGSLIFVTRLDTGMPVEDVRVTVTTIAGDWAWVGLTDRNGVALAAESPPPEKSGNWPRVVVTAEKDGDLAFVDSIWWRGPSDFRLRADVREAGGVVRGSLFTDRGVYRERDEVQLKIVLREDTPAGMQLLPEGTAFDVIVRDARDSEVDRRTVRVDRFSSAEWSWLVPPGAALGYYDAYVSRPDPTTSDLDDPPVLVSGRFLVSTYRTPDFRVETTLAANPPVHGTPLQGSVAATYMFGAPVTSRPVQWWVSRERVWQAPAFVRDRFPAHRYAVGSLPSLDSRRIDSVVPAVRGTLGDDGRLTFEVPTPEAEDVAYEYTLGSSVDGVSGQPIASRTSFVVHPASLYVAMSYPRLFAPTSDGVEVEMAAVDLEGRLVADVEVGVTLFRHEWTRPADSGTRVPSLTPVGEWSLRTTAGEVPLHVPVPEAGSYVLRATARDAAGRQTRTDAMFYSIGPGRASWSSERNTIELVPERTTWMPGESARILIQSPWERATALLTVEREGIRRHETFTITSTQDVVEVPITEEDVPNVFVSVVLVKGRTSEPVPAEPRDLGRPQYRVGHTELLVDSDRKRLRVDVSADREEYEPGGQARLSVRVEDVLGQPASADVAFWAVDEGVLSLTDYATPDVLGSIYRRKTLQVTTTDSRERLLTGSWNDARLGDPEALERAAVQALRPLVDVSNVRSSMTIADEPPGFGDVRDDFRPLAFWLGSVTTGRDGLASRTIRLPDSLTTYRVMAVAQDRQSRFGSGEREIRTSKRLTLLPALPRFLSVGDRASFGGTVTYTGATGGDAVVTIESRDPGIVRFDGPSSRRIRIEPGLSQAIAFDAVAQTRGRARLRMLVALGDQVDAFELPLTVNAPMARVASAAYGEVTDVPAVEALIPPSGAAPELGGLTVELSSTALVGLGESARYVVAYRHRSAEQRTSEALVLLLASELGGAFDLPNVSPSEYRSAAESGLRQLTAFQCRDGGVSLWPGQCPSALPPLSPYLLDVLRVARLRDVPVDEGLVATGLDFMDLVLRTPVPDDRRWVSRMALRAYAAKLLAEYGQPTDDRMAELLDAAERLPAFALSFLADALVAQGDRGPQYADLLRRLTNAVRITADRAHVEEDEEARYDWLQIDNIVSTAIVLEGLARRQDAPELTAPLARWLLDVREEGHWGNTYRNASALRALVAFYRVHEAAETRMTATVALDAAGRPMQAGRATFRGRSTTAQQVVVPMRDLFSHVGTGSHPSLSIARSGAGRLYYTARMQAFVPEAREAVARGFAVERTYARVGDDGEEVPATSFARGDLVRVTISLVLRGEGRFLALTDPLPAGFEPVEGAFATTDMRLAREATRPNPGGLWSSWWPWTFDHAEKHDDRVVAYATRLGSGRHVFTYLVRAVTAGTFDAPATRVEAMYAPELEGRSDAATIEIR